MLKSFPDRIRLNASQLTLYAFHITFHAYLRAVRIKTSIILQVNLLFLHGIL